MAFVWLIAAIILGLTTTSAYDHEIGFIVVGSVFCAIMAIRSFHNSSGSKSKSSDQGKSQVPPKPEPKPEPPKAKPAAAPAKPVGKFCQHCGAKVEPEDIYCIECGERI